MEGSASLLDRIHSLAGGSEETGNVSYASGGELHTAVTPSDLRDQLHKIQKLAKKPEEKKGWHIRGMRQKVEGEKK